MDIILFDSKCFRISPNGTKNNALYPIEGVIAAIEIKTNLFEKDLHMALDNCFSVLSLETSLSKSDRDKYIAKFNDDTKIMRSQRGEEYTEEIECYSTQCANEKLEWLGLPATYILSFFGFKDNMKFFRSIGKWIKKKEKEGIKITEFKPMLPRIIFTPNLVSLTKDEIIKSKHNLISVFQTNKGFSLFITHLLSRIADRVNLGYSHFGIRYNINNYNFLQKYEGDLAKIPPILYPINKITPIKFVGNKVKH